MKSHKEVVAKIMAKKGAKAELKRLETEEMPMLDMILDARKTAGLTQAEVAKRMGSSVPAVSRLENALLTGGKPSPSLDTLHRYAKALGKNLTVSFH